MLMLYVIGIPGSGKTSTLYGALGQSEYKEEHFPFAHEEHSGGIALGRRREQFGGTDALSLAVQPKVLKFLAEQRPPVVVGEGDRLATDSFFEGVQGLGYQLNLVLMDTPVEVAAARVAGRVWNPDGKWLKGRLTKVARLTMLYNPLRIDGTAPLGRCVAQLAEHPAIQQLRGKMRVTL